MGLKGLIKLLISAVMLVIVYRLVDFDELKSTFMSVPPSLVLITIAGFALTQAISSARWWLLARAGNIETTYFNALKAFYIGMYANCFGLGTLGGDVLRGALLTRKKGQRTQAIASAFADRALGLAVLAAIGVLAVLFAEGHHMDNQFVLLLSAVGVCVLGAWVVGPFLVLRLVPSNNPFRAKIESVLQVLSRDPAMIGAVVGVAAIYHLAQISLQWVMAQGLGADVSFVSMLVTVPFVNILSTLPITWNGVGVREKAYIFFFVPAVFTHEQAVALGALWLLAVTTASALGGVLAFLGGGLSRLEASSAE
jgi:uncharacterized membrane protein YbhN (UPF0104 family)